MPPTGPAASTTKGRHAQTKAAERELEVLAKSKADVPPDSSNVDDDTSSTSSSVAAERTGRAQAKRLRVSRRRHRLVEARVAAFRGGLIFLERKAVRPQQPPEGDAHLRGPIRRGRTSSSLRCCGTSSCFFDGHQATIGEQTSASLSLLHPMAEYGRNGVGKDPQSLAEPPRMKQLVPWAVWTAVAWQLSGTHGYLYIAPCGDLLPAFRAPGSTCSGLRTSCKIRSKPLASTHRSSAPASRNEDEGFLGY